MAAFSIALALASPPTTIGADRGQSTRCPGTFADVATVAEGQLAHVCEAAAFAEATLADCGVRATSTYSIRLEDDIRNAYGSCIFGRFRSAPDVAAIITPQALPPLLAAIPDGEPMSIYRALPERELHRSLIVHEVSHAIVHQNFAVAPCLAAHEYIAAVAQIRSLSPTVQQTFLGAFAGADTYTTEMFNDIVLAMNPARFAAAAYRHFELPQHGCAFVRRLLRDGATLPRLD